jgi:arylsulfatase
VAHRSDSSDAVRVEVRSALDKLEPKASATDESRKLVVKLGGVHNGTRVKSPAVERDVLAESKKKLDELGVADNTIVVYTTDNGFELLFWPDAGYSPFRGEKGTSWEGGFRVPCMVKWPGKIKPHSVSNGVQAHEDLFVTLAAAAGASDLKEKLLKGAKLNGATYKVHLDGYNNLDHWMGKEKNSARREFFYYDETDLMAVRVDGWKMHIGVKKNGLWWGEKAYPSVPYVFNLLMDPMEKMDPESEEWGYVGRKFFASKMWVPTAAQSYVRDHLKSLKAYPPRQAADTLSLHKALEGAMARLESAHTSNN